MAKLCSSCLLSFSFIINFKITQFSTAAWGGRFVFFTGWEKIYFPFKTALATLQKKAFQWQVETLLSLVKRLYIILQNRRIGYFRLGFRSPPPFSGPLGSSMVGHRNKVRYPLVPRDGLNTDLLPLGG